MYAGIKRIIDFILAILALIVLAIPMAIVAICVKAEDGGSVFFIQDRIRKKFETFSFIQISFDENESYCHG